MHRLHDIQRAFAADLLNEGLAETRTMFVDDKLFAARRFSVYRNNFQSSHIDVLAAIYPVVKRLLGSDFFALMAGHFVRRFPSRSGNVTDYGEAMPEFLAGYDAVADLPYLADVAKLEWSYHTVFHAAAPAPFDADALRKTPASSYPDLHFDLGPACRLVNSTHPIFKIWETNQEGYTGDTQIQLHDILETVMVVRPKLEVELWRLEPAEAAFLAAIDSGLSLGEAARKSLIHSRDFNLQETLVKHLSAGSILLPAPPWCRPLERVHQSGLPPSIDLDIGGLLIRKRTPASH